MMGIAWENMRILMVWDMAYDKIDGYDGNIMGI